MLPSEPGVFRYGLEGRIVRCPWHLWAFDVTTGRTAFGIDRRRLISYPVIERNGSLYIEFKRPHEIAAARLLSINDAGGPG